jgi:hypothetical protein
MSRGYYYGWVGVIPRGQGNVRKKNSPSVWNPRMRCGFIHQDPKKISALAGARSFRPNLSTPTQLPLKGPVN